MEFRQRGGEAVEQFFDDGLFRVLFRALDIGVGVGHGNIHQPGLGKVVHQGHRHQAAEVEAVGVLVGVEQRQQRHEVTVRGDGFRFRHAAQHIARARHPVKRMNGREESEQAFDE